MIEKLREKNKNNLEIIKKAFDLNSLPSNYDQVEKSYCQDLKNFFFCIFNDLFDFTGVMQEFENFLKEKFPKNQNDSTICLYLKERILEDFQYNLGGLRFKFNFSIYRVSFAHFNILPINRILEYSVSDFKQFSSHVFETFDFIQKIEGELNIKNSYLEIHTKMSASVLFFFY